MNEFHTTTELELELEEKRFWTKGKIKFVVGFVAGVAVTALVTKNSEVLVNSFKQNNIALFGGKNIVTTELARRGHPGFICQHLESGLVAASKSHMQHMLNVSHGQLQAMIESGDVVILGEAQ